MTRRETRAGFRSLYAANLLGEAARREITKIETDAMQNVERLQELPEGAGVTMDPKKRRRHKLDRMFWPDSVAVVGASPKGGFGADLLGALKKWGYPGRLAAVNPRYEQINGIPCYPTLTAIPHQIDLVQIAVNSRAVLTILGDCESAGVGAIQIISSGFAELGEKGMEKQSQLSKWAERTGIPVAGPNCSGLLNAANGLIAITSPFQTMKSGGISAVVQSGLVASSLLMSLLAREIGIARAVTVGNEVDLDVAALIDYLVEDEGTRVIACYCEQIKRPQEFVRACERAADFGKPIVMLKIGRSEGARKAALAHTGAEVGDDCATDATLAQLGVARVDTLEELVETAAALSSAKRPRGGRVFYASYSGGASGIVCDLAGPRGLDFPPLPEKLRARLKAIVPEYGSVANPLDLTGQSVYDTHIIEESLRLVGTSGAYDVVVWGSGFPSPLDMRSAVGLGLQRAVESAPDVFFAVVSATSGQFFTSVESAEDSELVYNFDGLPLLQGMGTGLKALSSLIKYAEFQRTRSSLNSSSP